MARRVSTPIPARRRLTGGVARLAPERVQAWIRARQLTADSASLLRYRSLGRLPRATSGFPATLELALAPDLGPRVEHRADDRPFRRSVRGCGDHRRRD